MNYIENLKQFLKIQFKFLTRRNHKTYFQTERKTRSISRKYIIQYIDWFHLHFFEPFLEKFGLRLHSIELVDHQHKVDKISIDIKPFNNQPLETLETLNDSKKFSIYRCKERKNISDSTYQDLINSGADFPSLRFVKEFRGFLDSEFEYKENSMGRYVDPKKKIEYYFNLFKDSINVQQGKIHIRLAGDGTIIAKNYSMLNFSFGFLNEIDNEVQTNPNSVTGNFTLGAFVLKQENYEELNIALAELIQLLAALKTITVNGFNYDVEFWLGGDLKFLSIVLGRLSLTLNSFSRLHDFQVLVNFRY